jgi:hypothetical protein
VVSCCECGDEPSDSSATELVSYKVVIEGILYIQSVIKIGKYIFVNTHIRNSRQ